MRTGIAKWIRSAWRSSSYRLILSGLWSASPVLSLIFLSMMVITVGLSVALVFATGSLVGKLPAAISGGTNSAAAHRAEWSLLAVVGILFGVQVVTGATNLIVPALARTLEGQSRHRVMSAALAPPDVLHLQEEGVADEIAAGTMAGTAPFGPYMAVMGLGPVATGLMTGISMAIIVGMFRWWLGVLLAGVWLLTRNLRAREMIITAQPTYGSAINGRRRDYLRSLGLTPDAAKELRIFGLAGWLDEQFSRAWDDVTHGLQRQRRERRLTTRLLMLTLFTSNIAAFLVIVDAARRGEIDLSSLSILLQATSGVVMIATLGTAPMNLPFFVMGAATLEGIERLEQRFGVLEAVQDSESRRPIPAPSVEIRFEGASFRYPGAAHDTIHDLDLALPVGRSLAIVGENGAGKTTLVKLLCALLPLSGGALLADGVAASSMDPEAWRSRLAVVFQDFAHFALSARDNLTLGSPNFDITDEHLREAATRAGLTGVLHRLPAGWDTPLSPSLEGGVDLSGGEWQRVAIARALVAVEQGASILILDEPTANLDIRAEAEFYDRFLNITAGLTTVLISHRFATVQRADTIAVLEHGRISEIGTHDTLLSADRTYARLFRLQAQSFNVDTGHGVSSER